MDQATITGIITILGAALVSGAVSIIGVIIGKRKDRHDAAQAEAVTAGTQVDTAARISAEAMTIIKDLRDERVVIRKEYNELKAEILQVRKDNYALQAGAYEASRRIRDIEEENASLRGLIVDLQAQIKDQDATIVTLTDENKVLRAELEVLKKNGNGKESV